MVETRFPESGLSAEYGDIVISEVSSELVISVSYSGNVVLSEKYVPDSEGKVAFKNLGKIKDLNKFQYKKINKIKVNIKITL